MLQNRAPLKWGGRIEDLKLTERWKINSEKISKKDTKDKVMKKLQDKSDRN